MLLVQGTAALRMSIAVRKSGGLSSEGEGNPVAGVQSRFASTSLPVHPCQYRDAPTRTPADQRSISATCSSSFPGSQTSSASSIAMRSPEACRRPRFLVALTPRFPPPGWANARMRCGSRSGYRNASSLLPSTDPSSQMSNSQFVYVCACTLSTASPRNRAALKTGTSIDTSGWPLTQLSSPLMLRGPRTTAW